MAREVLSVRISAAAKRRLFELAEAQNVKAGDILDALILHAGDDPVDWGSRRGATRAKRKASARAGRVEGEKLVEGLREAERGEVTFRDTVRRQEIPRPDWKD